MAILAVIAELQIAEEYILVQYGEHPEDLYIVRPKRFGLSTRLLCLLEQLC